MAGPSGTAGLAAARTPCDPAPAANALIRHDPARATALFIHNSGSKIDPASIQAVLANPQTRFETGPHGFMRFVDFMQRAGTIRAVPKTWQEAFVPELEDLGS